MIACFGLGHRSSSCSALCGHWGMLSRKEKEKRFLKDVSCSSALGAMAAQSTHLATHPICPLVLFMEYQGVTEEKHSFQLASVTNIQCARIVS